MIWLVNFWIVKEDEEKRLGVWFVVVGFRFIFDEFGDLILVSFLLCVWLEVEVKEVSIFFNVMVVFFLDWVKVLVRLLIRSCIFEIIVFVVFVSNKVWICKFKKSSIYYFGIMFFYI